MSSVANFRKEFSKKPEIFNSKLFNINENKPIHEYVVDYYKAFSSPDFELMDWEYIDKPHMIDIPLNRINIKNKKIREDQDIKNIVPLGETLMGELKLKWLIKDKFKSKVLEKSLLIPEYRDNELLINGNRVLPIKQIIDTIYSVEYKNKIAIKSYTTLTISRVMGKYIKLKDEGVEQQFKQYAFRLYVFGKNFSPLLMYYARYGVRRTLKYFSLGDICEIIPIDSKMIDREVNNYYKINENLMLEVTKGINSAYMDNIVPAIIDSIPAKATFDEIMDSDDEYWYRVLGQIYSTSKSSRTVLKKGRTVATISFKLALDILTKSILDLPEKHKKDSWAIVRYMMFHFDDIVKKKHNLKFKRMRLNEYIALGFIHSRDDGMHSYINSKVKNIKAAEKLFNFKPNALIKSIQRKKETAKLIRYNANINDLQAINLLRYSLGGPQGISTTVVSESAVDFYPSYLGKLDPNSVSSSSPGVTGLIVPFAEVDEKGYFYPGRKEPIGKMEGHNKSVLKLFEDEKKKKFRTSKLDRRKLNYGNVKFTLRSNRRGGIKPFILNHQFINNMTFKLKALMKDNVVTFTLKPQFYEGYEEPDNEIIQTNEEGKLTFSLKKLFVTKKKK